MKNIALIIAGGVGARTHQDIPKQFIHVKNVPVIIYTLKAFQDHPGIDAIEVACLEGWHEFLRAYARQFGISKLENIVNGGETNEASLRNGLWDIAERYKEDDDVVLVHDAIRPLVSADVISDCIRVCRTFGNAVPVIPCTSVMLSTEDSMISEKHVSRDHLRIVQTPQTFFLNEFLEAHREAVKMELPPSADSSSFYIALGRKIYLSRGAEKNIKITAAEDIEIFQALLEAGRPEWLKKER